MSKTLQLLFLILQVSICQLPLTILTDRRIDPVAESKLDGPKSKPLYNSLYHNKNFISSNQILAGHTAAAAVG